MLIEVGFMDLTIEGVAAKAGVGKPTIYRRWTCKAFLAMEAFLEIVAPEIAFPDTGSAKEDFREQMYRVTNKISSGFYKDMTIHVQQRPLNRININLALVNRGMIRQNRNEWK